MSSTLARWLKSRSASMNSLGTSMMLFAACSSATADVEHHDGAAGAAQVLGGKGRLPCKDRLAGSGSGTT